MQKSTRERLEEEQRALTSALITAAESGDVALVENLLAKGADANAGGEDQKTPLMAATGKGNTAVVQLLLARGANLDATDKDGKTALMMAARLGNIETVQSLCSKGANVNARDNDDVTALMIAAVQGHTVVVRALLDRGADLNARSVRGQTAMAMAVPATLTELENHLIAMILKDGPGSRFIIKPIEFTNVNQRYDFDSRLVAPGRFPAPPKLETMRLYSTSFGFPGRFTIRATEFGKNLYEVWLQSTMDRLRLIDMDPVVFPLDTRSVVRFVGEVTYPLKHYSLIQIEQVLSRPPDPSSDQTSLDLKLGAQGNVQSWGVHGWRRYSSSAGNVIHLNESPEDLLLKAAGLTPSAGNVIRLTGSPFTNHLVFIGEPGNPLALVFLEEFGLVYLYGKGLVKKSDGTILASWDLADAEAYNKRGLAYYEKGDYDRAIQDFSVAISLNTKLADSLNPKLADAYSKRGMIYLKKDALDRTMQDFSRAISLDLKLADSLNPKLADAYNKRGLAYTEKGDYDRAIQDFNQAISLDPKLAEAYNKRGVAYYNQRYYHQAIGDFSQAISLDPKLADSLNPKLADAYNKRGLAYYEKRDYDRAIRDLNQAISLDPKLADSLNPKLADAYNKRGLAYYEKGDYNRAIQDFSQAISLDPKGDAAYQNRAKAYRKVNEKDLADADKKKAKELGKQKP